MSTRNTGRSVRRGIHVALVAALVSIVGAMVYQELRGIGHPYRQAASHDMVPSLGAMFDYKPTLLIVGDSYADTYPDLVADKMGWSLALDAQDGTGFVHCLDVSPRHVDYINPPPPRVRFIDRLDRDAATYNADYVLIDGGRSDIGEPPESVVAAAEEYIENVHSKWPKAKIIVLLPAYATPDVAANYPAVAEGLSRAAENVGADVIDPVEQGWYRDIDVRTLQKDRIHLNDTGEIYYARRVIENLKRMGGTS
jgi:hypothetical protein